MQVDETDHLILFQLERLKYSLEILKKAISTNRLLNQLDSGFRLNWGKWHHIHALGQFCFFPKFLIHMKNFTSNS